MKAKFLISGTPRSGTTFLMALLHSCGIDIGYTQKEISNVTKRNRSGLEYFRDGRKYMKIKSALIKDTDPDVIKYPMERYEARLFVFADRHEVKFEHAILARRNVEDMISSLKKHRYRKHPERYTEEYYEGQQLRLIQELKSRDITFNEIRFPEMVLDAEYCYQSLKVILDHFDVSKERFFREHDKFADKDKVHFGGK